MECLPENLKGKEYYIPTEQGMEKSFKNRKRFLEELKKRQKNLG
jgi:putative ATPase